MTLTIDSGLLAARLRQGKSEYVRRTSSANSCRTTRSIKASLEDNSESTSLRQSLPFSSKGPNSSTIKISADLVAVALRAALPNLSPLSKKVNRPWYLYQKSNLDKLVV